MDDKKKRAVAGRIKRLVETTRIDGKNPGIALFAGAIETNRSRVRSWILARSVPGGEFLEAMQSHRDIRANTAWVLGGQGEMRLADPVIHLPTSQPQAGQLATQAFEVIRDHLIHRLVHVRRFAPRNEIEFIYPSAHESLEVLERLADERGEIYLLLRDAGRQVSGPGFISNKSTATIHGALLGTWAELLRAS